MEAERTTRFAGALAAQLSATLARVFGDRVFSMRFVFPSLMISLGAIAAAYMIEFLRVAAAEHMLCKYAFVLERPTYPNLIIPFSEVGTDPSLAMGHWMAPAVEWYAESWYARNDDSWLEMAPGYYAPPLDGIWATAPFFHNGSVPTLDAVIDPKKHPALWASAMGNDDYDLDHVGWKNNPFEANVTLTNDLEPSTRAGPTTPTPDTPTAPISASRINGPCSSISRRSEPARGRHAG